MSSDTMVCPFCEAQMQPGAILGDRYALKWQPDDKAMILGLWSTGHAVGRRALLSRPRISGYRCASCRKIIADE